MARNTCAGYAQHAQHVPVALSFALSLALGGSASAQSDLGSVDILGRTFECSGDHCSSLTQEAEPGRYASNRDCGFSVQLGTDVAGRETYLWVFCDTPLYAREQAGQPYRMLAAGSFMQSNSAGLAVFDPAATAQTPALSQKTRTSLAIRHDVDAASHHWAELIPRPELPCAGYAAAWPGSAVLLPNERNAQLADDPSKPASAVVLIFFQDVCVEPNPFRVTRHGTRIAVWTWSSDAAHDPHQQFTVPNADPAHHRGLRASVLTPHSLFENPPDDSGFQYGATVDNLGIYGNWLRVLRCHDKNFWYPREQPKVGCELAQVQLSGDWQQDRVRIADIGNWRYLHDPYATTGGWRSFARGESGGGLPPDDAYDLTQSGEITTNPNGDPVYPELAPTGHTSLIFDPKRGRWAMLSMIWGFSDQAVVRTARALTGPWSAGRKLLLPEACRAGKDGCYAPTFHAELSDFDNDRLGYSFVDNDGLAVIQPDGKPARVQQMRYGTLNLGSLPASGAQN